MRINQFIAAARGLSRREADRLIAAGRVTVNDQVANPGDQVGAKDKVRLAKELLKLPKLQYLAINKPAGYVTSRVRQGQNPTIYALLPTNFHHLKPVGRLDKDTQGLLLLTNDGPLAQHLTHPSYQKIKKYELVLNRSLNQADARKLEEGVIISDGVSHLKLEGWSNKRLSVSLSEGRNRQIRRTLAALGYQVFQLKRTSFGKLKLYGLKEGEYKLVKKAEIL